MKRRANCCACSTSPSRPRSSGRPRKRFALKEKNLSHGETEFDQQERAAQEARPEARGEIREAESDRGRRVEGRDRAPDRSSEDGRSAAQREPDARAQTLPADRPLVCL